MTRPWLDDGDVALYHGSALEVLRSLPAGSVQTCVTSPPYWGLRDYGTGSWTGGDAACRHAVPATGSTQNKGNNARLGTPFADECGLCGARRVDAQLGLEPTPDCGRRKFYQLRSDLTADQRAYVLRRLAGEAGPDA